VDALSAQGLDRAVVAAKARELGYTVSAAAPKLVEPIVDDAVALQNALNAQQKLLSDLLDNQSGAKLRRARRAGETESTTEDAVTRSEPYQGMVKYAVQFRGVSVDIEKALRDKFGAAEIRRVDFVDAQVAKQLQTDGLLAVIYALLLILVYVAIRFDFFFSPGAVIALVHDAIGALLVFSLGRMEFVLPSIAALLTVVGYSINNTIVIYDRIRETVPTDPKKPLTDEDVAGYVNRAINDTFSRTINTSLTTLCASVALAVFAGGVVQNFAIVLSVGIILGALSSTFLAPATYLWFRKSFQNNEPTKTRAGLSREDKARGVV
jgi:preprotein translocase SecF subunit